MKNIYKLLFFIIFISECSATAAPQPEEQLESQFGCTCAGLIACESFACTIFGGVVCIASSGRGDAICLCKKHLMKRCDNWDKIINDSSCSIQKNDYEHNNCGDCSCWPWHKAALFL